jgi:hypothetical protein
LVPTALRDLDEDLDFRAARCLLDNGFGLSVANTKLYLSHD